MNYIINENKLNKIFDKLNINNINNKIEKKYPTIKYVGQTVNGLREGKGIFFLNNGDRYGGDWKNYKYEGRGVYYYNSESIY